MKHLLSSVIVVTCSLLASRASATSPACSLPSNLTASFVADRNDVPPNAQLPIEWSGGCGTASLETADGARIDAEVFTHREGLLVLRPRQPLAPHSRHVVAFEVGGTREETISFTTGDDDATSGGREAPDLEVRGVDWDTAGRGATFRLGLKQRGAEALGSWSVTDVTNGGEERGYLAKGEEDIEARYWVWQINEGVETCFKASYVDATGAIGPVSARACVKPANRPPPSSFSADSDSDKGSCSVAHGTSGNTVGLFGFAAIALAFLRRRRKSPVR